MDFKIDVPTTEGFDGFLVSVEGELEISTVEQLADPAEVAIRAGCPLVLDLSECSFIDSTVLRFVLRTHRALSAVGEAMAVVSGDNSHLRKLLSITAIDLSVPVFATREEAIERLRTEGDKVAAPQLAVPAR
jgi:anti-sigma B factor antagonist